MKIIKLTETWIARDLSKRPVDAVVRSREIYVPADKIVILREGRDSSMDQEYKHVETGNAKILLAGNEWVLVQETVEEIISALTGGALV